MDPAAAENGLFWLWVAMVILGLFTLLYVARWYKQIINHYIWANDLI